jgi:hypothetical protein
MVEPTVPQNRLLGSREGARDVHMLLPADVVPDAALDTNDADEFDHAAIAGRVAELVVTSKTR